MKQILLVATFAILSLTSWSQTLTYGAKLGLNLSNLSINDVGGYAIQNPMRAGFVVGGFVAYNYGGILSSQVEILYSSQGTMLRDDNGSIGKIKLDYINIPMLAKINVFDNLNVNLGVQVGFLVRKKFKDDAEILSESIRFHSTDISIPVGISYDFPIGLILDLRYNLGLVNSVKRYAGQSMKSKNGVLQLSGAWRF